MNDAPLKNVWRTYFFWLFFINLAFFISYPLCNWIASQRGETVGLYLDAELGIPFVPQFVWVYFSMNLLFVAPPFFLTVTQLQALGERLLFGTLISSLVFLSIPTHLGFSRTLPADPFYQPAFLALFHWDQPHNLVPSLHVVYSALTIFSYLDVMSAKSAKIAWLGWLVLIMASTVLVHQHHLADVFVGLISAMAIHRFVGRKQPA